jgi:hypothetical protein
MDGFDEARTVKVLNISSRATQRLFNIFFEPCGKLTRVHISAPADESPEKRGGWALVEFDTTTAAQTALRFSGCVNIFRSFALHAIDFWHLLAARTSCATKLRSSRTTGRQSMVRMRLKPVRYSADDVRCRY